MDCIACTASRATWRSTQRDALIDQSEVDLVINVSREYDAFAVLIAFSYVALPSTQHSADHRPSARPSRRWRSSDEPHTSSLSGRVARGQTQIYERNQHSANQQRVPSLLGSMSSLALQQSSTLNSRL